MIRIAVDAMGGDRGPEEIVAGALEARTDEVVPVLVGPAALDTHGLGGLTKVMALELAAHGITVNNVAPGEIATPMTGNEDVDPRTVERPSIPARRPGDAREIASLVVWLCSDGAAYTTGSTIVSDGGLLLMAAERNAS